MSDPYIGQIKMFGGNFAPRGWAFCSGQLLDIAPNTALFSLLGTAYGGDGRNTFGLPDLRGRSPFSASGTSFLGTKGGAPTHTLTAAELPGHTHTVRASNAPAASDDPSDAIWASSPKENAYGTVADLQADGSAVQDAPATAHSNMQPYLAITMIIALTGIYPSRS